MTTGNGDVPGPTRGRRQARDLAGVKRMAVFSHLRRASETAAPPNYPPISQYAPAALWNWVRSYLAYVLQCKHFFPPHTASRESAMYPLPEKVRVSLVGDWGTGTVEAVTVAERVKASDPHYTIHLGDVYYVGGAAEVNENCLNIPDAANNYQPVLWPEGSMGSFALNGNHEMYANGGGYFDVLLPRMGLKSQTGEALGQRTSFFCLENAHWRVVAIDTGYNSTGVPLLSMIPYVNRLRFIGGDCRLPDPLMTWLSEVVKPGQDRRGLVILSHHHYHSAYERGSARPAKQLWTAGVRRPVLWFWGHDHHLAGYPLTGSCDLKAHGRCVGHGGMPIELDLPTRQPMPTFYDRRRSTNGYGMNGHADLTFDGADLAVKYVDLNGKELLGELWRVDADGAVVLVESKKLTSDPDFVVT